VQDGFVGQGMQTFGDHRAPEQMGGMVGKVGGLDGEADDPGGQRGHVPAPDLTRAQGDMRRRRLGRGHRRAGATAVAHWVVGAQDAVKAGFADDGAALVGELRNDMRRRPFGQARFMGHREDLGALGLAEGMRRTRSRGQRTAVVPLAVAGLPALVGPPIDAHPSARRRSSVATEIPTSRNTASIAELSGGRSLATTRSFSA